MSLAPEPGGDALDRLRAVFREASRLPADERAGYLEAACDGDDTLRAEVEALLAEVDDPHPAVTPQTRLDELRLPDSIAGYEIRDVLGRGGMGIVYRALQERPRRDVALKVLQPGFVQTDLLRRFVRETEVLGTLHHPGIAAVYGAGTFDSGFGELPYFAMELIDGTPIDAFAKREQIDDVGRCRLIQQVCDAMQHAHEQGVVHRDLKPGNLLVEDDEAPRVRVLDFGIARAATSETGSELETRTGQLFGTLPYMSPEQVDKGTIDARADVYATGVVLYELLSGELPLDLTDRPLTDALRILRESDPRPLREHRPDLKRDLETVVACAMAKEPEQRYPSMRALRDDLERALDNRPIAARRETRLERATKFVERNRILVAGVGATFLALLVGLVAVSMMAATNQRIAGRELEARLELRSTLYSAQMDSAGIHVLRPGNNGLLRGLVAAWPDPAPGEPELRGWEYRLLSAIAGMADVARAEFNVERIEPISNERLAMKTGGAVREVDAATMQVVDEWFPRGYGARPAFDPESKRVAWVTHENDRVRWAAAGASSDFDELALDDVDKLWMAPGGRHLVVSRTSTADLRILELEKKATFPVVGDGAVHTLRVTFSADGTLGACTYSDTRKADVFELATGRTLHSIPLDRPARAAFLSPSGSKVAIATSRGVVLIHDLVTGEREERARDAPGTDVISWSPDETRLGASYDDGRLLVHVLGGGGDIELRGMDGVASTLAFSPDGARIYAGEFSGALSSWSLAVRPALLRLPQVDLRSGPKLSWTPDGSELVVGRGGVQHTTYDLTTGGALRQTPLRREVSADGELVATESDELLHIDRVEGGEVDTIPLEYPAVWSWSPRGRRLAVHRLNVLRILSPGSEAAPVEARIPQGRTFFFAWSGDGERVALCWGANLSILDARAGTAIREIPMRWGRPVALNADGSTVAIAIEPGIRLFDVATGVEAEPIVAETLERLAWHPEGSRIAATSGSAFRIWDVERKHPVFSIPEFRGAFAWSPDGRSLALAANAGPAWVLDADRSALRDPTVRGADGR